MKLSSSILISFLFVLCGCKDKEIVTLKVACNLPMTGELGYIGQQVQTGLLYAVEQNMDNMDSLNCKIEFDFQDNAGIAKNTLSIFQKQSLNSPDLYMSGVTSQTMSIIDIVKSNNYPHYIWSFTPLQLHKGDNLYRTFLNLGIEADQYIKLIKEMNCRKVVFIYNDIIGCKQQCDDYLIPAIKIILPTCKIIPVPFPVETPDVKNYVLKAKEEKPDLIIINGFKNNIMKLVKYLHYYNMTKECKIIGSFDLFDAASDLKTSEVENIMISLPAFLTNNASTKYVSWKKTFKDKYKRYPEYTDAYAFDCGQLLVEVAKRMKSSKSEMSSLLTSIKIEGVTGPIQLEDNGDLNVPLLFCRFQNGIPYPIDSINKIK